MLFSMYPYQNYSDYNLDYLINKVKQLTQKIDNFVIFNAIKYADPIAWNITTQYEGNTVVINPNDGTAYLSTRPVPSGVSITNTDYWTPIFNYGESLNELRKQIAAANEEDSTTATEPRTKDELVWLSGELYRLTSDIAAGTQYIVGTNIEKVTLEEIINETRDYVINSINWVIVPELFGAVGNGVADDTTAVQQAIEAAENGSGILILPNTYYINEVKITKDINILGGELKAHLTQYAQTKRLITCESAVNVLFNGVKFNGNSVGRNDSAATLENMIRINGANSVIFRNCEICNHSQSDANSDDRVWYLRQIHAINCIDCGYVEFDNCYIHNNHTEQISIGSANATTICKIVNCRSDNNNDAYGLFILHNLNQGLVSDNVFTDNRRTFIHILSHNVTVSNNRLENSTSRGIGSEANAQAVRIGNLNIVNNSIVNCAEGGIDCGIDNVIVTDNAIHNCGKYAINFSGKLTGTPSNIVDVDEVPYDVNALENGANIVCKNNVITNHSCPTVPAPVLVRPEMNDTNGTVTYGKIENINISGNYIEVQNANTGMTGICFIWGKLSNVTISDNVIKRYNLCGIMLSYNSGNMMQEFDGLKIIGNVFTPKEDTLLDYCIRNFTCENLKNVYIRNNRITLPVRRAFFVSPLLNSIHGYYQVTENETLGCPQTLRDYRFHINGNVGFSANLKTVYSFTSLPNGLQLSQGDILTLQSPDMNANQIAICNTSGTSGTLSGCTGTTTAGSNVVTVNNSDLLKVGDDIVIAGSGITKTKVFNILSSTQIRTVDNIPNAVSGAAITYFPPVLVKGANMTT